MPPFRTLNAFQKLPLPEPVRLRVLAWMSVETDGAIIDQGVHFSPGRISIGARTYVGVGCFFDGSGGVTIGARCGIGERSSFITSLHRTNDPEQRAGDRYFLPVVVEDGCWLGAEVMVLPGVTIAQGCVVGARSVLTRSTEPNGLYVGSPAVRKRDL